MNPVKAIFQLAGILTLGVALSARGAGDELPPRHVVDLFGQRIEYYDVGSGPTLVLLHGLATSAQIDWGACINRLSRHYRVLAPDQLGFGASAKPMITYGIQTWVDFLGEFLRVEKVHGFTLSGESLGGWIGVLYTEQALGHQALAGPSFLLPVPDHLILVDAAGHRHMAEAMIFGPGSSLTLAGSKGLLSAIYFGPEHHTDEAVRRQFATSLANGDGWTMQSFFSNRAVIAESVDDLLGKISVPTLVVWGAEDHAVPLDDGKDYAAKIPGAKLVVVPDSGHAPGIEKPDALCAAIEQFLGTP
jgi:pimeloyl-ACP methyl ester carboxylesterase